MEYTGTLKKTTAIDFCETEAPRRRDDAGARVVRGHAHRVRQH